MNRSLPCAFAAAAALLTAALGTVIPARNALSAENNDILDTRTPVLWLNERAFGRLEQHLDELYRQVQDNPADEYKLYLTYAALGEAHGKTTAQLRQWLKKRPRSPQAHLVRAAQVITRTSDRDMLEKAALDAQAALSAQPDHPMAHYYAVRSLCAIGGAGCIEYLLPLQNENAPHAYFARRALMGFMQPRWGANSDMLPAYLEAAAQSITLNPHWRPFSGYGDFATCTSRYDDEDYQSAAAACEKALSYGTDDLYAGKLTDTLIQLGKFGEARQALEQLPAAFPSDYWDALLASRADAFVKQGRRLENDGKVRLAIQAYSEALQLKPDNIDILLKRGLAYRSLNQWQPAEDDFKRVISLDIDNYDAHVGLDYTLFYQRRIEEIVPIWNGFLARNPDKAEAYLELSGTYVHLRDFDKVRKNARKACQLGLKEGCERFEEFSDRR